MDRRRNHFGIVRREAFDRVGGLDEEYLFWFADDDFSRRLLKEGYVIREAPAGIVTNSRVDWSNPNRDSPADWLRYTMRWG
jgi:GT2 family glycosyltransferase